MKLSQYLVFRVKNSDFFYRGVVHQKGFLKKKRFRILFFFKKTLLVDHPPVEKIPFFTLKTQYCDSFIIGIHHSNEVFLVIGGNNHRQDPP